MPPTAIKLNKNLGSNVYSTGASAHPDAPFRSVVGAGATAYAISVAGPTYADCNQLGLEQQVPISG
jgi:hypothetical protein